MAPWTRIQRLFGEKGTESMETYVDTCGSNQLYYYARLLLVARMKINCAAKLIRLPPTLQYRTDMALVHLNI